MWSAFSQCSVSRVGIPILRRVNQRYRLPLSQWLKAKEAISFSHATARLPQGLNYRGDKTRSTRAAVARHLFWLRRVHVRANHRVAVVPGHCVRCSLAAESRGAAFVSILGNPVDLTDGGGR